MAFNFQKSVALIIFGIRNRRKGAESHNWPSVPGTITNISLKEDTDTDSDGYKSTMYTPKIEYQYELGSQSYTSDRITFGGERGYGRLEKAQEVLEPYTVNTQVSVYYNPSEPSESVLVQGTKGTMGAIIAGVVLVVMAFCGGCAGLYLAFFA